MALDTLITGDNLDAAGNVKVSLPNTPANVGAIRLQSENDAGTITGVPYLRPPETSSDYRLRVGTDTLLFTDSFNATTQNTSLWSYAFVTLTASQPGAGTVNFGTVQGTASTHGAYMRTFQYFPIIGTAPLAVEVKSGIFTAPLVANEVCLFGLGLPAAAGTAPADGIWFQITTAGVTGVMVYNNTTTQTGTLIPYSDVTTGTIYNWAIVVGEHEIEFWRNDILLGELSLPVGQGQPFLSTALPLFLQKFCSGSVSNTATMRVSDVTCTLMDVQSVRAWSHQMAIEGQSIYNGQNGGTMGTTQATGTITTGSSPIAPTGAAGSNTAANVTGLGGWGSINAAAGAATDFIATSFQNPAGTINITGRNLVITGVAISTMNGGAAVATTSTTLLWSIAFGHTAVSLATTETASFATGTTHAPRRVQLGFQTAPTATPIGGVYSPDLVREFQVPIVVRPGEFLATIMKIAVGTATASQTIVFNVMFTGYFE